MAGRAGFTEFEARQDAVLGALFLVAAAVAMLRVYRLAFHGRKVIVAFNALIFTSAALRALWFFIPDSCLEPSYVPVPTMAFSGLRWEGQLVSQVFLSVGNITLFGSFIVIACYWAHILQKLHRGETIHGQATPSADDPPSKSSTLRKFAWVTAPLALLEATNVTLFLLRFYSTEGMALFDCMLFVVTSLLLGRYIINLSDEMNEAILGMDIINRSTSRAQARRIHAMMLVSSGFFFSRVVVECALGMPILWRLIGHSSSSAAAVMASSWYWTLYILLKHGGEVVALGMSLAVSSAIKSYDNRPVAVRRNPILGARQGQLRSEAGSDRSLSETSPMLDSPSHPHYSVV